MFPIQSEGGLYFLKNHKKHKDKIKSCKSPNVRSASIEEWRKVLGHVNTKDIEQLEKVVEDMHISAKKEFVCETCPLSKQVVHRSRKPDERAKSPLEFVHSDIAGPINPVAKGGFRYIQCGIHVLCTPHAAVHFEVYANN